MPARDVVFSLRPARSGYPRRALDRGSFAARRHRGLAALKFLGRDERSRERLAREEDAGSSSGPVRALVRSEEVR